MIPRECYDGLGNPVKTTIKGEWLAEAVKERADIIQLTYKECGPSIESAAKLIIDALQTGHRIIACGNGGSAADAQHFVAELVGRYKAERTPLPAIALSSDPSVVTALANDYGYDQVFARQVRALASPGDILLAITTSGTSPNVVNASRVAREIGMICIALTGSGRQTPLAKLADVRIQIPSVETSIVQEMHTFVLHYWCDCIERIWQVRRRR